MNELLDHEPQVRMAMFLGVFGLMMLWEIGSPRRALSMSKPKRWLNNLGLLVFNSLVLRLLFPGAAVGIAVVAESRQWGLFHQDIFEHWPAVVLTGVSLVLLDGLIWYQHRLFHSVPALWRLHRLHHADTDFDVTTALRFHPLEILLSMLIKAVVVITLGVPVLAVLAFEILLNASAMFNHANIRLSTRTDRVLRTLVVTPDMHRVHHSWHSEETHSNFGFCLSWWDKLAGTYIEQPRDGHQHMVIGLRQFRKERDSRLDHLLMQPFVR